MSKVSQDIRAIQKLINEHQWTGFVLALETSRGASHARLEDFAAIQKNSVSSADNRILQRNVKEGESSVGSQKGQNGQPAQNPWSTTVFLDIYSEFGVWDRCPTMGSCSGCSFEADLLWGNQ